MWTDFEAKSAKLEEVFDPLHARASEFDRSWSIAELQISDDDITWLRSWFRCLTPNSTENWIKSIILTKFSGKSYATYRQMFGALLVCAGAETCRRESNEDSVWPAVRGILPSSHALQRELFLSNGQPSSITKLLIEDAVRALNLRHAMDIEGTQKWFITLKLQFGFTYRGAKNRLAEWLVNIGRPHAAQYLNGESELSSLTSQSFKSLWRALTQYRRGLISETEIRSTLELSPWVHPQWIDTLLKEAKARLETLGIGDWHDQDDGATPESDIEDDLCPITQVTLHWPCGTTPRLRFELDRQVIQNLLQDSEVTELDFYIDGRKIARWLRQEDRSWSGVESLYGEPDNQARNPNLRPQLLTVRPRSGETLIEWDLIDSGLALDVLVFDLDRERLIKVGQERLELNHHYAIVCDRNCRIDGCEPIETFESSEFQRKAIRLPAPLSESLRIAFEDFVLWQPTRLTEREKLVSPARLVLPEGETLSLNDRTPLVVDGLPHDTESVQLLIHTKTYDVELQGEAWETVKKVTLTPELAAGQRRTRVKYLSEGVWHTVKPSLSFRLLSAAMLRDKADGRMSGGVFEILQAGDHLNRSEETRYLRVWVPEQQDGIKVLEGNTQIGRLRHGKVKLRDFPGHGGRLKLRSDKELYDLEVRCEDSGCVRSFSAPIMKDNLGLLEFNQDKDPTEIGVDGYSVWEWHQSTNDRAILRCLSEDAIARSSTNRKWKVACSPNPIAIAITWKGFWLGAWWELERQGISNYFEHQTRLADRDFATIKWLRLPVLDPQIKGEFLRIVQLDPCRFLRTWLGDMSVPNGVKPHDHIEGLYSVVRQFLWCDFPAGHTREAIKTLTNWDGNLSQPDQYIGHLDKLAEVSPLLIWSGLKTFLGRDAIATIELLRAFTCSRLGLSITSSNVRIRDRLRQLQERTAQSTGIDRDELSDVVRKSLDALCNERWQPTGGERDDLTNLGESLSGRQYFSTCICCYWLELSGQEGILT